MMSSKRSNKPNQYIKGYVEWYKLKLKVTPNVLIPRPETELLVDEVLLQFRSHLNKGRTLTILDIGTGSGNIAIALTKNLDSNPRGCIVKIIATDVSAKALKVAEQNAKLHGVQDQIEFIESDLLSNLMLNFSSVIPAQEGIQLETKSHGSRVIRQLADGMTNKVADNQLIIVTNLPYIPTSRIPTLDSSVKDFEPYTALDGGENGFKLYEKLFTQIKEIRLNLDLLVGEIDYTHGKIAVTVAHKYFPDMEIGLKKDLARKQRLLIVKKPLL